MKFLRKLGVGAVFSIGVFIGAFSLYDASRESAYAKLGLSEGSYAAEIQQDEIRNFLKGFSSKPPCTPSEVVRDFYRFRQTSGVEQALVASGVAARRFRCGAVAWSKGKYRRGMLSVVKGKQYLVSALTAYHQLCRDEKEKCSEAYQEVSEAVAELEQMTSMTSGGVRAVLMRMREELAY